MSRHEARTLESVLADVQQFAHVGNWDWDLRTDIVAASDEYFRIFGVERGSSETTNDLLLTFVHPLDQALVEEAIRQALEEGVPYRSRYRIIRPDGAARVIHEEGETLRGADGRPMRMIGTTQDITDLVESEELLRDRERDLAEAQRIGGLGSWERDVASGALRWSDESYRIMGVAPGTFAGTIQAFTMMVHPEDRAKAAQSAADLTACDPAPVDYRIIRPDGSVRFLHEESEVIRDRDGAPIRLIGTTQDITDRVNAGSQQTRFARLLDELTSEIYVFDADTLRFAEVNAGALRNTGYTMDELRQITPLDLKPAHTSATFDALVAPLRDRSRDHVAFDTVHRRKDGTSYPVGVRIHYLDAETPAVFVAIIQDITERVAAEAERTRLAAAVGQTADAVMVTDRDGRITYVNPSFERLFGYRAVELLGQDPRILKSGRHEAEHFAGLWATIQAGRTWSGSFMNRRKDGALVETESVVSPIRDGDGEIVSFVQTDRDVTHERALETALAHDARERETIQAALELMDPDAEPEVIVDAACGQILRLTGVDFGLGRRLRRRAGASPCGGRAPGTGLPGGRAHPGHPRAVPHGTGRTRTLVGNLAGPA